MPQLADNTAPRPFLIATKSGFVCLCPATDTHPFAPAGPDRTVRIVNSPRPA
jgi:hypothetical protein